MLASFIYNRLRASATSTKATATHQTRASKFEFPFALLCAVIGEVIGVVLVEWLLGDGHADTIGGQVQVPVALDWAEPLDNE